MPPQRDGSVPASQPSGEPSHPERVVTVLSVSAAESDHLLLGHLFRHTKWTLLESKSCAEAAAVLGKGPVPVVICDCTLPDGDWKHLLHTLTATSSPPMLIVASRLADDRLWFEVMNHGAFDVLEKPFNQAELVRVVSLAWLAWKDRWQRVGDRIADPRG